MHRRGKKREREETGQRELWIESSFSTNLFANEKKKEKGARLEEGYNCRKWRLKYRIFFFRGFRDKDDRLDPSCFNSVTNFCVRIVILFKELKRDIEVRSFLFLGIFTRKTCDFLR